MRKIILVCAAVLCFAGVAAAQNGTTATVTTNAADSGASRLSSSEDYPWQVGTNFVYQKNDIGGSSNNLFGIHTSVTRWLHDGSLGIEGAVTATFGSATPINNERFVFYGGGAKYAIGKRSGKYQPWAHILAGGAHTRFNQGVGPASFNGFAIMGGGGLDLRWRSHISWRFQGDFLGTRIGGLWQKSIVAGAGIVFNF